MLLNILWSNPKRRKRNEKRVKKLAFWFCLYFSFPVALSFRQAMLELEWKPKAPRSRNNAWFLNLTLPLIHSHQTSRFCHSLVDMAVPSVYYIPIHYQIPSVRTNTYSFLLLYSSSFLQKIFVFCIFNIVLDRLFIRLLMISFNIYAIS